MDIVERLNCVIIDGKSYVKASDAKLMYDEIERLREVSQQQLDAAYRNGYDAAYAMGYSEGLKETLYDGMPRRDDRGDNLEEEE